MYLNYKIKNYKIKNIYGGTIPTIINLTNEYDKTDKENYVKKKLPFYYNFHKLVIVNKKGNFLNLGEDVQNTNKYLQFDNNFNMTLVCKSFDIRCYNSSIKFSEIDYWNYEINILERTVPFYYCFLNKYSVTSSIYNLVNIQDYKKFKYITDMIFNKLNVFYKGINTFNVGITNFFEINVKGNIIDKYIFINKFYELLVILLNYDYPDNIENNKKNKFENTNNHKKPLKKTKIQIEELIINVILNNDLNIQKLPDILLILEQNNLKKNYLPYTKNLACSKEYMYIYKKFNYIKKKLDEIFYYEKIINNNKVYYESIDDNQTTMTQIDKEQLNNKFNFVNLVHLYKFLPTVYDPNKNFGSFDKDTKKINDAENDDAINSLIKTEIVEIFLYSENLLALKNYKGLESYNLDLILLLTYFYERVITKNIIKVYNMYALPLNQRLCMTNLLQYSHITSKYTNTVNFIKESGFPEIYKYGTSYNIAIIDEKVLRYPVCVEHGIIHLVRIFFWNFEKQEYDFTIDNGLNNTILYQFIKTILTKYNETIETKQIFIKIASGRLLANIEGIEYNVVEHRGKYEVKSNIDNILKCICFLLYTHDNHFLNGTDPENIEEPIISKELPRSKIEENMTIEKLLKLINDKIASINLLIYIRENFIILENLKFNIQMILSVRSGHTEIETINNLKIINTTLEFQNLMNLLCYSKKYVIDYKTNPFLLKIEFEDIIKYNLLNTYNLQQIDNFPNFNNFNFNCIYNHINEIKLNNLICFINKMIVIDNKNLNHTLLLYFFNIYTKITYNFAEDNIYKYVLLIINKLLTKEKIIATYNENKDTLLHNYLYLQHCYIDDNYYNNNNYYYNNIIKLIINKEPKVINCNKIKNFECPLYIYLKNVSIIDNVEIYNLLKENININNSNIDNKSIFLIYASKYNNIKIVKDLICMDININSKDKNGNTALIMACENSNLEIIKILLEAKVDLDIQEKYGRTALMFAISYNFVEIVKILIEAKADINISDKSGTTALVFATMNNSIEIVDLLIKADTNLDIPNTSGTTALMDASRNGYTKIVDLLIKAGTNLDIPDKHGDTAFIMACENGYLEIVKILICAKVNINIQNRTGDTALMLAIYFGHLEIVKILIKAKAYLNIQNLSSKTALIIACENGNIKIVKLLIKAGSNLNITDINKIDGTALMYACEKNNIEIFKILICAKIDVNLKNSYNSTALIYASKIGNVEIVKMLLDRYADPNIIDNDNSTALIYASKIGNVEIVQMLLDRDIDPNIINRFNLTALYYAIKIGNVEIVQMLLDRDVDPNIIDNDNSTALIYASKIGNVEIVQMLLDRDVDPNIINRFNLTALYYAIRHHSIKMVELLINAGADLTIKDNHNNDFIMIARRNHMHDIENILREAGAITDDLFGRVNDGDDLFGRVNDGDY